MKTFIKTKTKKTAKLNDFFEIPNSKFRDPRIIRKIVYLEPNAIPIYPYINKWKCFILFIMCVSLRIQGSQFLLLLTTIVDPLLLRAVCISCHNIIRYCYYHFRFGVGGLVAIFIRNLTVSYTTTPHRSAPNNTTTMIWWI